MAEATLEATGSDLFAALQESASPGRLDGDDSDA